MQAAPQLIPAGMLVTVPLPVPVLLTVRVAVCATLEPAEVAKATRVRVKVSIFFMGTVLFSLSAWVSRARLVERSELIRE
jgi:hypothetical protein